MSNAEWMQKFCGNDETRYYLMRPFSRGESSYATNGHILVRVARDPAIADVEKEFNPDAPLKGIENASFSTLSVNLPPAPTEMGDCKLCDGRGYAHDCPDCECVCEPCKGTGEADAESRISTTVRGQTYSLHYIRMMLGLPNIQVAESTDHAKPLFFKFDGGDGAVMQLRSQRSDHIEIEPTPPPSDADR